MKYDWVRHRICITRVQLVGLIMDNEEINTRTLEGARVTIGRPTCVIPETDDSTKHSVFTIFSHFKFPNKDIFGKIKVRTDNGESYTGTIIYQEL